MDLIGRQEEIQKLQQFLDSPRPEFMAIYGRRRVGKTYLIRQFFKNKNVIFFNVTGTKEGGVSEQIENFIQQIGKVFYYNTKLQRGKDWREALEMLTVAMEQMAKNKKIVLFIDELPWMATRNSKLLRHLEYYWNQFWSDNKNIKLIICGSSASWIIDKIIKNKGGLHNRITQKICLEPFKLPDTKRFLIKLGVKLTDRQILLIYMITGGIPYYLLQIEKGKSAAQIIEQLAFSKKAFLLEEFDSLFASLFDDHGVYIQLVKTIAKRRYGIGKTELLAVIDKSLLGSSGIKKLQELEETGFILSFKPLYHKRQGVYYRLVDEYTLFYLKWIEPFRETLQEHSLDPGSWQATQNTPEFYSWLGYAFESVCYKHISAIRRSLAISPNAVASAWRYMPTKKDFEERGAQIDLLFDRKDDAITLCEIKYSDTPFVLTKDYVDILKRKISVFKEQTQTKKQLFMTMVTAGGLKNNYYAEDLITGFVTLNDLFNEPSVI